MARTSFVLFVLLISSIQLAWSYSNNDEDGAEYVLRITPNDIRNIQRDVDTLYSMGLSGIEVNSDNIEVYVSPNQRSVLEGSDFNYEVLKNPSAQIHAEEMKRNEEMISKRSVGWDYNKYFNYVELSDFLTQTEQEYPTICEKFTIGKSAQGRDLWGIRITSNIAAREDKPEFKYVGNMHGDETVGRQIMIQTIHLITTNYRQPGEFAQRITKLVDSTDIYIIPSMNPDGFELGRRSNANYMDLNRNFPDLRFPGRENSPIQPETQAMMDFISQNHTWVLSANFHGGSVVANYPYDGNQNRRSGAYEATSDDDIFRYISLKYSTGHSIMSSSAEFANGITNGAQWYVLYGGMQDWNYVNSGCMEITVELSEIKYPSANSLQMYWEQNQRSVITYMEQVHTGIKGKILASNGDPVQGAKVYIQGRDRFTPVDPKFGSYYRLVRPGSYTVRVTAPGFETTTKSVVVSSERPYQQTSLDFTLKSV